MDIGIKSNCSLFSLEEVSNHCDERSCWMVINDQVYDVTLFMVKHPGGVDIMLEYMGTDATVAFEDKGHSKYGVKLLEKYFIGELVEKDRRVKRVLKTEP